MGIVYLAALVVGLGTVLVQLVGVGASDADGGADGDAHVDVGGDAHADVGGDAHADADHAVDTDASVLATFLSLRFWTFLLMAFGMVGSALHFLGLAGPTLTLALAVGMGLVSGWVVSWVFRALARATTTSGAAADAAVGRVGKVLVPLKKNERGKIRIEVNGQLHDFLASTDEPSLDVGDEVLVVEMRDEAAHVAVVPPAFEGSKDED